VLVENVPGLLAAGMGDVLGDLAAIGYDAEWDRVPAAFVGAPHIRGRIFVVAYPQRFGRNGEVANADSQRRQKWPRQHRPDREPVFRSQRVQHVTIWLHEPDVGRVADGIPRRVDRLRALGNAVVPQVAEHVGRLILAADREAVA
jgi:DNA (cytosine-5)-methyltransferase 1